MGQRYKENRLLAVEQEITDRQIAICEEENEHKI
jgi:hypothetical protein